MQINLKKIIRICLIITGILVGLKTKSQTRQTNDKGIYWPEWQALPFLSTPVLPLKVIDFSTPTGERGFSNDEIITFASFQGLVNKVKTEIALFGYGDALRRDHWLTLLGLSFGRTDQYSTPAARYRLVNEYKDRINGLVVYNAPPDNNSPFVHYRNAASTIANIFGYLPVTPEIKTYLANAGVTFPASQTIDITGWTQDTPLNIYQKIYDEYWPRCSKRLLIHMSPGSTNRLAPLRDLAAATGAAIVWLDTKEWNTEERDLYKKFMKDMADTPGTSIVLGWGTTERSVISAGAEFGISLIPSDDYANATIFSATEHQINIPKTPKRPPLENKLYLAMYITDGDNIQYVQGSMKSNWDNAKNDRGKVAVNWTISPGLVDIGPGILNYYYNTASAYECFVAGPSGMGYIMPINTIPERERDGRTTAYAKTFLTDLTYMDNYTRLTQSYLQRSGMRVLTIWDDANTDMKNAYERNCRYLYGATIHAFGQGDVTPVTINNRLHFSKHTIHYESNLENFKRTVSDYVRSSATDKPLFSTYQLNGWRVNTGNIVSLYDSIKAIYGDKFEFIRADHFYSYYNEYNELPFNLTMLASTKITGTDNPQFEFDRTYSVSRYVIRLAEIISGWKVEASANGQSWTLVDECKDNTATVADITIPSTDAKFVKITFTDAKIQIADIEIYGAIKL